MKRTFFLLTLILASLAGISQSKAFIRADSVYMERNGGNSELILLNATRDSLGGLMTNIGKGRTKFLKPRVLTDSTIIIGRDTLKIRGTGGSGGSGSGTVNSGSANRLVYYAAGGTTVDPLPAITASRALVSDLNGLPSHSNVSTVELNRLVGVTSSVQTQINSKQATLVSATNIKTVNGTTLLGSGDLSVGTVNSGAINRLAYYTAAGTLVDDLAAITGSRALASDASGLPVAATTTAAELNFVSGVTSAIQTQINAKLSNITALVDRAGYISISGLGTSGNPYIISSPTLDSIRNGLLPDSIYLGPALEAVPGVNGIDSLYLRNMPNTPTNGTFYGYSGGDWGMFTPSGSGNSFSTGLTELSGTVTNNLSTGVSGGQSVVGGTASGNNLTLSSTSNATKGKIIFGNSTYSEVQNQLVIGKTSPSTFNTSTNSGIVQIINDANAGSSRYPFQIQTFGDATVSSSFESYRAGGTYSSPTATLLDMPFLSWGFRGYDGAGDPTESSAAWIVRAAENFTASAQGSKMTFEVTPLGTISRVTALTINPDGSTVHKDRIDISSAASVPAYLRTMVNGVTLGVFGVSQATNSIITGSLANDLVIRAGISGADNYNMLFSVSGGDDVALKLNTSNHVLVPSGFIGVGSVTTPTTSFHGEGTAPAMTLNATSSIPYVRFQLSGATKGMFGVAAATDNFVTGTVANDFVIRAGDPGVSSSNIVWSTDATGIAMKLNTSGALGFGSSPSFGTSGQFLKSNGSGAAPSWVDAPGGSGSPAGSNTQIQYNNSGSFGASANLTFASNVLEVGGGTSSITLQDYTGASSIYAIYPGGVTPGGGNYAIAINDDASGTTLNSNDYVFMAVAGSSVARFSSTEIRFPTLSGNGTGVVGIDDDGDLSFLSSPMLLDATNTMGASGKIVFPASGSNGPAMSSGFFNMETSVSRETWFTNNLTYVGGANVYNYASSSSASRIIVDNTASDNKITFDLFGVGTSGNAYTSVGVVASMELNENMFVLQDVGLAIGTIGATPTTSGTPTLFSIDVAGTNELRVIDEAGNATTLSPHNFSGIPEGPSEEMAWSFYSERDGKYINVDMLKLVRIIEKEYGVKLVYTGKTKKP